MRYFVMSLALFACTAVNGQPLPDPFVVMMADSQASFSEARVTMRDSVTADIFYVESRGTVSAPDNHLRHVVVSLANEQVIAGPEELPCTNEWNLTIGDVGSRGSDGWIALLYEATPSYHGAYGHNRTRLMWGRDAITDSALLDTGRMAHVTPEEGDHTNSVFSLCPREGGGWLALWLHEGVQGTPWFTEPSCTARVVTFDHQLTRLADQFFGREAALFGPMWVRAVSWSADSALALLMGNSGSLLNWIPRVGEIPLAYPGGCGPYSVDFRRTHGGRFVVCNSDSLIWELHPPFTCDLLGSTGLEHEPSFIGWHRDLGYAFLENYPHVIMLARVDTSGHAVQPPGSFYESDPGSFIAHSAAAITPNGRVVVQWGERQASDAACTTLKMAWVDWTTYLGVRHHDFILNPSSFILSAFPNPFNARTEISFDLPHSGKVRIQVFDILGREVARLLDERAEAGVHHISWNPSARSSGLYFARLTTPDGARTIKLCLTK